jgi:hypothetical protein
LNLEGRDFVRRVEILLIKYRIEASEWAYLGQSRQGALRKSEILPLHLNKGERELSGKAFFFD